MPRGRSVPCFPRGSHRIPGPGVVGGKELSVWAGCGPVCGKEAQPGTQPHPPPQPQPRRCRDALGGGRRQQVQPPGGRCGPGGSSLQPRPGGKRLEPPARPPPLTRPSRLPSPRSRPRRRAASPWRRRWGSTPALPRGSGRCRHLPPPRPASAAAAPPCATGSASAARPAPARLPRARSRSSGPASFSPPVAGAEPPFPSPAALLPRGSPGGGKGAARLARVSASAPVPQRKPSIHTCRQPTVFRWLVF